LVFQSVDSSTFEQPIVVDLFCLLYSGHSALGDLFWREHHQHASRRRFFDATQLRFPAVFMPLIRALTAVAGGAECSYNVFWMLAQLSKFTYHREELYIKAVRTQQAGPSAPASLVVVEPIYVNGVLLPVGTRGLQRESFVTWFSIGNEPFVWSAWSFFYRRIEQLCRMDQTERRLAQYQEEVTAILRLIAILVSSNHQLSGQIQDSIDRSLTSTPCSLFALFFALLNRFAPSRQFDASTLALVEECFRCITAFAHTHTDEVWVLMRESGLLEAMEVQHHRTSSSSAMLGSGGGGSGSGDHHFAGGGYSRHSTSHGGDSYLRILLLFERKRAHYPITRELLDLLLVMLAGAQQWQLDSDRVPIARASDYHSCLAFVQTEILACFDSWRYVMPQERWQIGIKVLDILERILTDVPLPRLSSIQQQQQPQQQQQQQHHHHHHHHLSTSIPESPSTRGQSLGNLALLSAEYDRAHLLSSSDGDSIGLHNQAPFEDAHAMQAKVREQRDAFVPEPAHSSSGSSNDSGSMVDEWRTTTLRRALLHSMLYDSSFHRVLLNAVGTAELVLARISARRKSGPKDEEQMMLEQFAIRALSVLEKVLMCRENRMTATVSPLEHALMNHVIGNKNKPLVLAIASFIHYQYNYTIPLLSTRVLTILCSVSFYTGDNGQHNGVDATLGAIRRAPSLVAYLGGEAAALCSAFLERLTERISVCRISRACLAFGPCIVLDKLGV
jgi:uncharacterized membrane protein YgcG